MSSTNEARRYIPRQTSCLTTVGNTPIVRLAKLSPSEDIEIWIKLEMFNPSGSIKDRIVSHIVTEAEKNGLLKPGGTIIENTSGNTGAAVAMIAAVKGYKAILTMPDKVSIEKQNALKAYGAEVVVCPTSAPPSSPDHYENKCKQLVKETPNSFRIDQYDNPLNPVAHELTTGPEIWEQMNGRVDYFVASGSTGGTITGIGRFLKKKDPSIKVVMPDPVGSVYYEFHKTGKLPAEEKGCTYFVEGIGEDHICEALDLKVVDEMYQFNDRQAFEVARRLSREEGVLGGGSTGANVWGCLQVAQSILQAKDYVKGAKKYVIVTVAPDSGVKYLSKIYNDQWMADHDL